jgi:formiminotetrahydrofolate cyclodeaminase
MINEVSVESFLDRLASPAATPGGGSAAALMGAMGAALLSMICGLTLGKKGYVQAEAQLKEVLKQAQGLRRRLASMIEDDVRAYAAVMAAYALPRGTDAERAIRTEAIQQAMAEAILAPLACARACAEVMDLSIIVAEKGNLSAAGEAGVAALAAHAALRGSALNVYINTSSIRNRGFAESKMAELDDILRGRDGFDAAVFAMVRGRLSNRPQGGSL